MVEPKPVKSVSFSETQNSSQENQGEEATGRTPDISQEPPVVFTLGETSSSMGITNNMAPIQDAEPKTPVEETVAERTLPWKRTTVNDPVPSLTSLIMADDENPLMSEAPSWVSNPSYHNLKESGSPYVSPQTTLTAPPVKTHTPSIFEIFQEANPKVEIEDNSPIDKKDIPIPPPWGTRGMDEEPVMSPVVYQNGDKSSNMLYSAHSEFPAPHHVIIPCGEYRSPSIRKSLSLPGKASSPQSPKHWQPIEMQDSVYRKCPSEAEIIFDEVVYQQDVKCRVAEWLQHTDDSEPEEYDGIEVNFNHQSLSNGFEIDSGEESDIETTYL